MILNSDSIIEKKTCLSSGSGAKESGNLALRVGWMLSHLRTVPDFTSFKALSQRWLKDNAVVYVECWEEWGGFRSVTFHVNCRHSSQTQRSNLFKVGAFGRIDGSGYGITGDSVTSEIFKLPIQQMRTHFEEWLPPRNIGVVARQHPGTLDHVISHNEVAVSDYSTILPRTALYTKHTQCPETIITPLFQLVIWIIN